MPQLSIIIVNWNSKDYLRKCLQSLYANTRGISFEIIVVDGASFDGCGEMLAREFSEVKFLQSEKNIGFAKANNLGFEHSSGDCILFLNPDTEVLENAITLLHDFLGKKADAGIVGVKLLNTDGSVQTSCIQTFPKILNQLLDSEFLRRTFPRHAFWGMAPLFSGNKTPVEVEVVSGACMMMTRSTFQKIGQFSDDYFLYAEDLDLCYKTRQIGLKNYYLPDATVIHHGGGSSRQTQGVFSTVMMRESVYRFLKKFHGKFYGEMFRGSVALGAFCRLLLLLILFPIRLIRGEAVSAQDAIKRWTAIFKWTLGLEQSVKDFG